VSTSRAYSDKRDKKNKYSGDQKLPARVRKQRKENEEESLCDGGR